MASKQETGTGNEWYEYESIVTKINEELNIRPYCKVAIIRKKPDGGTDILYEYDLPREMVWKYNWVLEWRKARFVCRYPRDHVSMNFHFYDKTSGLELGYQTLLSQKIAAKALMTKYRNVRNRYVEEKRKELFFDPETDCNLKKIDAKILRAEQRIEEISAKIETAQKKQIQ